MKFSTFIPLAAAIAGASAADVTDGLPSCATSCVTEFSGSGNGSNQFAGCAPLDIGCVCSNENFLDTLSCCLAAKCNDADQQASVKFAQQICAGAGVKVPSAVVCSTSPTAAPASATATGSASTTKPATSHATTSPTAGGKPAANTTTTGTSSKPTSGASSVLLSAGGVLGAAAAFFFVAL